MKYIIKSWNERYNKLGVLITNFIVTVIFVVSKLYNIIVLILAAREKKISQQIFADSLRKLTLELEMFSKVAKKDSQEGKAFTEYITVGVREEKGEQLDNNAMIIDPPILEHQSMSLSDNARTLGNRSEQVVESSLLLIGGIPCSLNASELDNEISTIAQLAEFSLQLGIDFTLLESNLRELSKKELILYTDGDSCSITIPLKENKTFALGGHSIFPPAFGLCTSEFTSFPFTCQAIPTPATHALLKKGLELAIFRGIPTHEIESQCVLALISDRVSSYYSPRLNHPIADFDIILHKRSTLGHSHNTPPKKSAQYVYYISVYIRPGASPLHTLKALFGLKQGPNPISCHWIGEVWEDYASLRVMSPSTILLDRTPVTSLAGFETPGVEIAVLVTALIQDNQTFPLHEVAYFWVEKIESRICSLNIVWKHHHLSVSVGNNIRALNNNIDVLISISAMDNPNMTMVRLSIAESIAHYRLMSENPSFDWNIPRYKQQWTQITEKLLRGNNPKINPLRVLPEVAFPSSHDVTSLVPIPCTTIAVNETTFPRLVPPTTVAKPPSLSLVPHMQEANMMALVAQAVANELDRTDASRRAREQKLTDQLEAIEKEQANARERESHTANQNAAMLRENREATEKMMQEVTSKFTAANEKMMQEVANQFTAALGKMTQFSSLHAQNSIGNVIPPAPQPPYKRRGLESSSITPTRGASTKRQIGSIPMEDGEIPQPATLRGLPAKPPDRDQRADE